MTDNPQTLAQRLTLARALARISGRRLAELSGLSPTFVLGLERGKWPNAGVEALGRIADVFGLSLDWLTSGRGVEPTVETVATAITLAEQKAGVPPKPSRCAPRCHECGALLRRTAA